MTQESSSADDGEPEQAPAHPIVGHVYWVASRAYAVIHQQESHPIVVLSSIAGTDEWQVMVRSSKKNWPGFDHPPSKDLRLNLPGRFVKKYVDRLPGHVFEDPSLCEHRGPLEPEVFETLMDWWLS